MDNGMKSDIENYKKRLISTVESLDQNDILFLKNKLLDAELNEKQVFLCGNGGSAGNCNHIVNDFIYGAKKHLKNGFKIESLTSNQSVITCLANDTGYDKIFTGQLESKASSGDLLICLSGSGNSPNIIKAIDFANSNEIYTLSILGYDGGRAKKISNFSIHTEVNDMQISEDMQLVIFHMVMQLIVENGYDNE